MSHAELKQAVMDALEKLFEDCSVSTDEMRDIRDEINSMMESLDD